MFTAVLTASAQDGAVLARHLLVDNGGETGLFTLTPDVPYTITHSKTPAPQFTINENGSALANATFPEAATITPIEVKLKNTWFFGGLSGSWTEVSQRFDGGAAITDPAFQRQTDAYLPSNAPEGAYYVRPRNLYGAVLDVWFSQEILYLPKGTYIFSVVVTGYSGESYGNFAYLYAEENEVKTPSTTPLSFSASWGSGVQSFTYTKTTDGAVKFGIYLHKTSSANAGNTQDWKFTNFSLTAQ
ncbi:hypothetical protein FACS189413_04940 [Bacteroidia bacterium]|nr:hypothetical protein FACS189413_04940 [Bacteroidia bacterium]